MKVCECMGEEPTRLETRTKETTDALCGESERMYESDPKGSELCVTGLTGGESLLEDPSCSDVQLDDVRCA